MRVADNILRSSRQHSSHLLRITGALMSLSLGMASLAACFPITSTPSTASTPSASSLSTGEAKKSNWENTSATPASPHFRPIVARSACTTPTTVRQH